MKEHFLKIPRKSRKLDGKNTMAPAVQQKNKLNNNIFLFIVRLLMVMIEYNFRLVPILYLVKTINLSKNGIPKANFSIVVQGTIYLHMHIINNVLIKHS